MPFFRLSDRVKDTTSSSGVVSSYALNNSPPTGYQSFSVIQNGNVTFYTATDGTDWETGVAAYCTVFGDELVKCTVTGSSNSNSSVNWGVGEKEIFISYPAARAVFNLGTNLTSTPLGQNALTSNTVSGNYNVAAGCASMGFNTSGVRNAAVGFESMLCNTTGSCNVAIGACALRANTIGTNNIAIGAFAMCAGTSAIWNVAIGQDALKNNSSGESNVGVGYLALQCSTGGCNNTAIGFVAQRLTTTGDRNVSVGTQAACAVTTGCNNVAMGACAICSVSTGCNNIAIGANAGKTGGTPEGIVNLTTESDRIVMGNDIHTCAQIKIAWTVTSDCRDKACLKDVPHGLSFVRALKPVEYQFKKGGRESTVTDGKRRYGFLAQDILPLEGEDPVVISTENPDKLQYTEAHMTPILVRAVQELASKIETVETRLGALENA